MLTLLRRWFRRTPPQHRPPVAPPAARAAAPVPAAAGGPAHEPPARVARPAPATVIADEDLAAVFTAAVRERTAAMLDAPAPPGADAGYHDGLRVLAAAVVDAPADGVRQLPSAAREALAVCDAHDAGSAELARICEGDLAVVRALLREANSVFYVRPGQAPAASIREAIERVGTAGVRNALLDVTVSALLCPAGSRHAVITAAIWAHAQRTAALARAAATAFDVAPERAYAAGLLHDVGKLVLLDRAAALAEARTAPPVTWPALRAALLALHEPLGALAVLRWGMGGAAARAIAGHHRTAQASPDPLAEVICLAERVDHASIHSEPLDLGALWTDAAFSGSRSRAATALVRHLGPMAPFPTDDDAGAGHPPSRLSKLAGR